MKTIWVEIRETKGSAPRDAGTVMAVTPDSIQGTIGGGALEHRAIQTARDMLRTGAPDREDAIPLGPGLGQCCGGSVRLLFTAQPRQAGAEPFIASPPPCPAHPLPLWVWGAGHVGRAVVAAAPAAGFQITWVDDARNRFPTDIPAHVTVLPAQDMPLLAARAPQHAHHLIFTYSHDIDLALCAALLQRRAASIGLIGSATKWARFSRRLKAMGLDPAGITCPIGDTSLGKAPAAIAHGTLTALAALTKGEVPA